MMVASPEAAAELLDSDLVQWPTEGDEEEASSSASSLGCAGPSSSPLLLPALVAAVAWGAISAGQSGCAIAKAKVNATVLPRQLADLRNDRLNDRVSPSDCDAFC